MSLQNAKKVFLYAKRSSSKTQENPISIEKQLETMRNWSKDKGFEIIQEFSKTSSSYGGGEQEQLKLMLNKMNEADTKTVLMYSKSALKLDEIKLFEDGGITIETIV